MAVYRTGPGRTMGQMSHIHTYQPMSRYTSFHIDHRHLVMPGSMRTSIDKGHDHAKINMNDGIVGI